MPTEIASFSAFDWNFDGVADSVLVACCYWEYARESVDPLVSWIRKSDRHLKWLSLLIVAWRR